MNIKLYKDDILELEKNEVKYQIEKDILTFELEKMEHIINLKEKTLARYNEEFHFYLDFLNEKCTYELKTHQIVLDIIVEQAFFEMAEKRIEMIYAIETDDQKTKIIIDL